MDKMGKLFYRIWCFLTEIFGKCLVFSAVKLMKMKVKTESLMYGENYSNPYIQVTTIPCDIYIFFKLWSCYV